MYRTPNQLLNYIIIVLTVIIGATVGTMPQVHIDTYQNGDMTYDSH